MPTQIVKYNELDFTQSVEQFESTFPKRINMMAVPKRHGGLVQEVPVNDPRRVSLKGKIQEIDATTCRSVIDSFEKEFGLFNKKFRLWDDRYVFAYPLGFNYAFVPGTNMASALYTVDFMCADPFWYYDTTGSSSRTLNSADTFVSSGIYKEAFTLNNVGNVFVYPTITVTASGTLTTIIVRNLTTGRNFTYTGTVTSGTSLVVSCSNFTVTNNGTEDLTNWSGSFLWLDPGNNSMEVQGSITATYAMTWGPRTY